MKKAVIYARYSCRGQTEQSIEGQLRKCHDFALHNDFIILNEYIDRAKTAQNDNRPAFQKMLADSEEKNFEYVIVYSVDRFARSDMDYGADKKLLLLNGVKLLSATETIGTNTDGSENLGGILTEGLLVALAKYYSRELSKKIKRGQFESIQKKTFLGGSVLYGYKIVNKIPVINGEQAEIVRLIFDLYSKGKSSFYIADLLKNKGILTNKGKEFVPNTLMNMLKNEKYIGVFQYGDQILNNYYPPIIEQDLFEVVQAKIIDNKRSPARSKAKTEYLLSGKLHCGYCKSLMTGESGTGNSNIIYNYYKCSGRKKRTGCQKNNYPKLALESFVLQASLKHVLTPETIQEITCELINIQNKKREASELTVLQKQYAEIKRSINNVLAAIRKGIITTSTQTELEKLEIEKIDMENKITQAEFSASNYITKEKIELWFNQFATLNLEDKSSMQYLITYFVEKIILYDDKIVIIYNHSGNNHAEFDIANVEEFLSDKMKSEPSNNEKFGYRGFGEPLQSLVEPFNLYCHSI